MSDNPLDRWEASIREGKAAEAALAISYYKHQGMICTDNTTENIKATDLRGNVLIEAKYLNSPYPREKTPAGLSNKEHLTLDYANVVSADPNIKVVLVVDYTNAGVPTKGHYYIRMGTVHEIIKNNPTRVYLRSSRSNLDKSKKVGISTKECGRDAFPGMTLSETVDEIVRNKVYNLVVETPEDVA